MPLPLYPHLRSLVAQFSLWRNPIDASATPDQAQWLETLSSPSSPSQHMLHPVPPASHPNTAHPAMQAVESSAESSAESSPGETEILVLEAEAPLRMDLLPGLAQRLDLSVREQALSEAHKPDAQSDRPSAITHVTVEPQWEVIAETLSTASNLINPKPVNRVDSVELGERLEQARELLQLGDGYWLQGELNVAVAHYRKAVKLAPEWIDAHQSLADALSQQGDLEEAKQHYQIALELTPISVEEAIAQAQQQAQFQAPAEPEEIPIGQKPWYEQAAFYSQQGQAYRDQGQHAEAIAACEQALQLLQPNTAKVYRVLGQSLQAEERIQEAEEVFRKALTIEPQASENYAYLAGLLESQQRYQEAVKHYQKAIEINPEFAGAHFKLGQVWQQLGDLLQAADCFYQALKLQPAWASASEHVRLGTQLVLQTKFDQGYWCYQQAIQQDPAFPDAYYAMAEALSRQKRWPESADYYQQAIERNPKSGKYREGLGRSLAKQERWQDAIDAFKQIPQVDPQYARLKSVLPQLEQCQQAIMADFYYGMAQDLQQQQLWQDAALCYRGAIERHPNSAKFQAGLAAALAGNQQWEEAIATYRQAVTLNPQNQEYRTALGHLLMQLKRFEEAAYCFSGAPLPDAPPSQPQPTPSPVPAAPPVAKPTATADSIFPLF